MTDASERMLRANPMDTPNPARRFSKTGLWSAVLAVLLALYVLGDGLFFGMYRATMLNTNTGIFLFDFYAPLSWVGRHSKSVHETLESQEVWWENFFKAHGYAQPSDNIRF